MIKKSRNSSILLINCLFQAGFGLGLDYWFLPILASFSLSASLIWTHGWQILRFALLGTRRRHPHRLIHALIILANSGHLGHPRLDRSIPRTPLAALATAAANFTARCSTSSLNSRRQHLFKRLFISEGAQSVYWWFCSHFCNGYGLYLPQSRIAIMHTLIGITDTLIEFDESFLRLRHVITILIFLLRILNLNGLIPRHRLHLLPGI